MSKDECCTPRMRHHLDLIFQALPACGMREISERTGLDYGTVNRALAHLRSHSLDHGWTVPHVRRGPVMEDERFVAVLIDQNGSYLEEESRAQIELGLYGTLLQVGRLCSNEANAVKVASHHVRSRRHRGRLEDLSADLEYIGQKAQRLWGDLVDESDVISMDGDA